MRSLFVKVLIGTIVFVLTLGAFPSAAQTEIPSDPPYSVFTLGAVGAESGLRNWSGGFLFGGEYPVAKGGDVALRFMYSQFNWNPDAPLRVLSPATVLKFDLGKGWRFWIVSGGELFIDGQNSGSAFFGGLGVKRSVLTFTNDEGNSGTLGLVGEITMTGAGAKETGDYWQLKIGVALSPPAQ